MPDIIVITGDLIDASHTDIGIALGFAQESVKIAPTYFVAGNHEAASPQYDTLKSGLEAANRHMRADDSETTIKILWEQWSAGFRLIKSRRAENFSDWGAVIKIIDDNGEFEK